MDAEKLSRIQFAFTASFHFLYPPLSMGLGLMLVGFVMCSYLAIIKIGGTAIGGRPLLLLGVLLIVVGIQLLTLGLLGEMVAATRQDVRGERDAELHVERVLGADRGEPGAA